LEWNFDWFTRPIFHEDGSANFLGLNYYTSFMARELKPGEPGNHIQVDRDSGVAWSHSNKWKTIGPPGSWLQDYPQGFRKLLNYIKHKYNNVTVLITENGCMDTLGEELHDETRIAYLAEHLKTISLGSDKCNVIGYTLWSLLDNFEWDQGYKFRFGIYHVDFEDADRKRTPKKSAEWYKEIIARNSVLVDTNNA
uniref:Beta-glucosidase n=1 Tax=Anisakis simplex TaxID=6269 RepID=A0A0M3K0F4_ANISI